MTQEALWIREIKPSINTKDEYRSRELVVLVLCRNQFYCFSEFYLLRLLDFIYIGDFYQTWHHTQMMPPIAIYHHAKN